MTREGKKSLGVSSQQHVKLLSRLICTQEGKEVAIYGNTRPLCYVCGHALSGNAHSTASS